MKKSNHLNENILLMGLLLIFLLHACSKEESKDPEPPATPQRGDILQATSMGTFSTNSIYQIFEASNIQIPFTLEFEVEAFSVTYYSVDRVGNQIITSGAFLIPMGTNNIPLLCTPHGTETKRDKVASVSPSNSTEGISGLMIASMGYFVVVPDYPGFGVSESMHPYVHAGSLVPSVIDFMRAAKSYEQENQKVLTEDVFLTGYSEGGYIALLTQKALEEDHTNEFSLTAVAPLAGLYDLKGMADTIFQSAGNFTAAYVGYFLTAYDEIYNWNRLDDYFIPPYASMMPGLFDGTKTWGEVVNQLPPTFADIMDPDFVAAYNNGNEAAMAQAFQENTLLDWIPVAPVHFFHGDADNIVPYQNVLTAMERFQSNGAMDVQLTTIEGGTHETAGPAAIFGAVAWIEEF